MPMHLPLPRAVGPYTSIRVTKRFTSTARDVVFGTFRVAETSTAGSGEKIGHVWTNVIAVEDVNGANPINGNLNGKLHSLPWANEQAALGSSALTAVPSAYTVQIMNPEALNTTTGIVYGGVMNTQAKILDRTQTWDSYLENFVAFQAPRMMSAGKLALRGVKASSYPLSMSQLSEFTEVRPYSDVVVTMGSGTGTVEPTGFAPILLSNPQGIGLEYLVTVEWRVRFDLTNPASAGHTHYPVASDVTWDSMMRKAVSMGHGFVDIADTVANAGAAAARVAALL